jgi:hypothetical protein
MKSVKKWLKFVGTLAVVALGIAAITGIALAQGPTDDGLPPVGPVDEDGDGLCDVCGQEAGEGFVRGRRFNQDDNAPLPGQGRFANDEFVDEDGDGLCDNLIDQDGDGVCDNFADEDGDGLCDHHDENDEYGPRPPAWGGGRGRMGGRMGRGRDLS